MMLHHETLPAILGLSQGAAVVASAIAGAAMHALYHAWIRVRYGTTCETSYRPEPCAICGAEPTTLHRSSDTANYEEQWLCSSHTERTRHEER